MLGWALTLFGGLGAGGGGLVVLAVAIGVLLGASDRDELPYLLLGTVVIGVVPALIGAGLFAWGVRRLNRVA